MARGDFEEGARFYREAANAAPTDAEAWLRLAKAELMAERPARAREAFERVAAIRPEDPRPVVEIGFTHELERAYDEALQSYERAVERAPTEAYPHRVMGTRLLRWGQAQAAVVPLERAVALDPEHLETWKALAIARHESGDVDGAREAYRGAIERHPESVELLLGLAAAQVNARAFEDALETYGRVTDLRPRFAAAHVGRAILLHELGLEDEAEAAFEKAVDVADDPEPFRQRLADYRALRAGEPGPMSPAESAAESMNADSGR